MLGLRPPSPESSRDRVLTDHELRAVWKAAEDIGYPFGAAIQLLILTGQRRSEVLEAEWSEIDLSGRLWTVPRERSKTDSAHLVPLSDAAADLLSGLPRVGARLVFTTNGTTPFSGVSKAFRVLEPPRCGTLRLPCPPMATSRPAAHVRKRLRSLGHSGSRHREGIEPHVRDVRRHRRRRISGTTSPRNAGGAMDVWASHVMDLVAGSPANPSAAFRARRPDVSRARRAPGRGIRTSKSGKGLSANVRL